MSRGRPRKDVEKDDIIRDFHRYHDEHGCWPTQQAFIEWNDDYSATLVVVRFGSWSAAKEAAKKSPVSA